MRYKFYLLFIIIFIWSVNAQVGVFTNSPKATLHVNNRIFDSNINGNLIPEGIGVTRISKSDLAAKNYGTNGYNQAHDGVIVFVDNLAGDFTANNAGNLAVRNVLAVNQFYMFDGNIWLPTVGEPPSPFVYSSSNDTRKDGSYPNSNFFKYYESDGNLAYENQVIPLLPIGTGSKIESIYLTPNIETDNVIKTIKINHTGYYDIKAYFGWNSGNNTVSNGNAVIITIKLQKFAINNNPENVWETISSATFGTMNVAAYIGTTLRIPNVIASLENGDMIRFSFQTYGSIPTTSSSTSTSYTPSPLKQHNDGTINKPTGLAFTEMIIINKI